MPAILFISENKDKIAEYREQLAGYALTIDTIPWHEDEAVLDHSIQQWLIAAEKRSFPKKRMAYALNEWSDLYNAETHKLSTKSIDMEPVYNRGDLIIYWLDDSGELYKEHKQHSVYGYVDLSLDHDGGFGWDRLFVNAVTGKTYAETIPLWGKCTPRQLLISDFIQQRLFYKEHKRLNFSDYVPDESVSFSSLTVELNKNPLLCNNLHMKDWGLDNFLRHAIADGIHLRFAKNRREGNYWMPGLNGGLPAVPKPDSIHETTYRFHDLTHYGLSPVCDLIPTDDFGPEAHRVYHAARMMSEAFSLVMADMLFIDTLKRSGIDYNYDQRNVYPLFTCIVDPKKNLKSLFRACTDYALLEDDSGLRALMREGAEPEQALVLFKEWYGRFFTADHYWTGCNFKNIAQQGSLYKDWHAALGDDHFKRARVPLLNDVVQKTLAKKKAGKLSYAAVVDALFDDIFEMHVMPRLCVPPPALPQEEEISNAFRRYMLGQSLFYIKYKSLPGMAVRMDKMLLRLQADFFDTAEIADIRKAFEKDVMLAHGAHVITHDDRRIYSQVFPVFPPVYLDGYAKQKSDISGVIQSIFEEGVHE